MQIAYFCLYICQNAVVMEQDIERVSVKKYWIIFFFAIIVQLIFLIWIREYFWMVLPFVLTSFCKGIRII